MRVINLPKSNSTASICEHIGGKKMTFSQSTDTIVKDSADMMSGLAREFGIKLTAFTAGLGDNLSILNNYSDVINYGIYLYTDSWKNPNNGNIELIPDYYNSKWTQNGVSNFKTAILGADKPQEVTATRYPNHGSQMYDASLGDYGYKNGSFGSSNGSELFGLIEHQNDLLFNATNGVEATISSYRNGRDECKEMAIKKYLSIRNSNFTNTNGQMDTWYGSKGFTTKDISFLEHLQSLDCSSRMWDSIKDNPAGKIENYLTWYRTQIEKTILNGGFIRDFIHWHQLTNEDEIYVRQWFELLKEYESDIAFVGQNEAIEYLYLRECIEDVSVRYNDVFIVFVNKYNIDLSKIKTKIYLNIEGEIKSFLIKKEGINYYNI